MLYIIHMLFMFYKWLDSKKILTGLSTAIQMANLIALLLVLMQMGIYVYELREFKRTFIVDLDVARAQFLEETRYLYIQGCEMGTDYVPTVSNSGFNTNSPIFYCNEKAESWQEYLEDKAVQLGRPSRPWN